MKKEVLTLIIVAAFAVGLFFVLRAGEDTWLLDERGIYIQHGNPAVTPVYVLEQQDAINCSQSLFENLSNRVNCVGICCTVLDVNKSKEKIDSQCLGTCGNYSVDIVHVPRIAEDDLPENQCTDYLDGKTKHFIELDGNGSIVRVM